VWSNRLYLSLWASQAVSLIGDVTYRLAIIVHVYNISGSALQVGTLMIFTVLPSLVFGSIAGVYIDRWRLKHTLIAADLVRAMAVAGIMCAGSLWQIYALTFVMNAASRFFQPAYGATVVSTVRKENLPVTNSFNTTTRRTIQLVLPGVAGVLIGSLGISAAFGLNAASYVVSAMVLFALPIPERDRSDRVRGDVGFWAQWMEGFNWVRGNRPVLALTITAAILGFPVGVNNALVVVFVEQVLKLEVVELGYLMSALTAGILMGGVLFGHIPAGMRLRCMITVGGLLLAGMGFIIFAFNRDFGVALSIRVVMGLGFSLFNMSAITTLQELAPAVLRGRVFTFFITVDETASLLFLGLAGLMADLAGIVSTFALVGVVVVGAALYLYSAMREAVSK